MKKEDFYKITIEDNGVAVIWMDQKGEKVNKISPDLVGLFDDVFQELNNNMDVINLTLPFVLAASCAFMMPIATPPNAIVYSSNKFKISFMASNGFFINLISVTVISLYVFFFNNF